jgi:hypothetical protein
VVAAVIASAPMTSVGADRLIWVAVATVGVPLTVIACAGRSVAATWAVAALGAGYAGSLLGPGAVDGRAPLVGAGLLVLSELIYRASGARSASPPGRSDQRGLVDLAIFGLAAAAIGAIVLAAGSVGIRGGVALAVIGVVSSIAILAVILLAARRWGPARSIPTD